VIYVLPVELSKQKIADMRKIIEKKNSVFAEKRFLDSMFLPSRIIGREAEAEKLLQYLLSLKDGFVVPFISVYGRSGSGKSTVVKFVCENLFDIVSFRFVNLRKAKTVFGCANLILGTLGRESLTSAEGLNKAVDCIECQIEKILKDEENKFFVLVVDEYDVIFSDPRGNPSDFVYKLLRMEENLREKGLWVCIISISNNALIDYELDDRVKSRMGSSEVSFSPYSKSDVLGILNDRAKKAFKIKVAKEVLEHCANLSSSDHGDARRAIDLLRTAGELCDGKITKEDVEKAYRYLQKDRVENIISNASYHMRCVAGAICSLAIVNEEPWSATSSVYKKYSDIVTKDQKPLSYRRVADLLVELENSGLLVSRAYSRGRHGYGREYKLKISPELVGKAVNEEFLNSLIEQKKKRQRIKKLEDSMKSMGKRPRLFNWRSNLFKDL